MGWHNHRLLVAAGSDAFPLIELLCAGAAKPQRYTKTKNGKSYQNINNHDPRSDTDRRFDLFDLEPQNWKNPD
jgi:hypothetical protein